MNSVVITGASTGIGAGAARHMAAKGWRVFAGVRKHADGEMLIVPQQGALRITTELGRFDVAPQQVALIPRGVRFQVSLLDESARGYICENYGALFRLPELGPIGANGLANARDFETPVAWFEDVDAPFELIQKFQGGLWSTTLPHSPFDVVGWHGNLAPCRYDLRRFNKLKK